MDCSWVSQQLPELLQGALERRAEQLVLEHLASCADCRRELAFWAKLSGAVREQARPLPRDLADAVAERLGIAQPPTLLDTLRSAGSALKLTGQAVRLALTLAQNH